MLHAMFKPMLKQGSLLLLLIALIALAGKGWHWAKDGFSIRRTHFPLFEAIDVPLPDPEIVSALKQPYSYLGRGHQCYAFESRDGRYVLKLPRYDRYRVPFWLRASAFSFLDGQRDKIAQDKQKRLRFMLGSFQIAFNELKEQTAVLYLHLNQTHCFQSNVLIRDRIGRSYKLNLDQSAFVLQRKKPLMMPAFQEALQKGDRIEAKRILEAFLTVVSIRAEKGIYNKDPSFLKNFAFDGGKGIQIDIGSFYRIPDSDPRTVFRPSFLQTAGHVQAWLKTTDPTMAKWFGLRTEEIARKGLANRNHEFAQ